MILLKRALQALGLWPQPGQVAPPCGYTPDQMRREVRSVIDRTDGELLLAMYQVVMVLSTMKDEATQPVPMAPPEPPARPTIWRNRLEFKDDADWRAHRTFYRQALADFEQILRDGGQS
ncbi:MAG: hypothetical protein KJ077_08300 [Anaerolineae bacterium]|nr:hypothetical protein [Anaerolineae bacterium]